MTDKEIELALEELAVRFSEGWHEGIKIDASDIMLLNEAAQALAQPEQEPVALPCCGYTDASAVKWNPFNRIVQCHNCGQTYTPPQRTWVGLTDDELLEIYGWRKAPMLSDFIVEEAKQELLGALRKVEAKLKEKNT